MKALDSAAVSIFVVILVELTNTVQYFWLNRQIRYTVLVNSTNISTIIESAVLSNCYPPKMIMSSSMFRGIIFAVKT